MDPPGPGSVRSVREPHSWTQVLQDRVANALGRELHKSAACSALGGLEQRARLLATPLGEALFAVTATGLSDHMLSDVRQSEDAPAETPPRAVRHLEGEDPDAPLRVGPPGALGLHQGFGHRLGNCRAALLVALAFRDPADEPVVRQLGRGSAHVHLVAMNEDPGERPCGLVVGIYSLVLEQQVGDLAQQFAFSRLRQGTLRYIRIAHRHGATSSQQHGHTIERIHTVVYGCRIGSLRPATGCWRSTSQSATGPGASRRSPSASDASTTGEWITCARCSAPSAPTRATSRPAVCSPSCC